MNGTQQTEALRLADKYEIEGFLQDHRFAQEHWCRQAAAELRRQHTRITELESQLSAIGAGGVEPLRKQAAAHGMDAQDAARWRHTLEQPAEGVPAQAGPVGYVALAALTSRTHADDYAKCFATEAALLENYPAAKAIAVFDHAATQPAAQRSAYAAKGAKEVFCKKCEMTVISNCGSASGCPVRNIYAAQAKQGEAQQ